jgi:protein SCO1/2
MRRLALLILPLLLSACGKTAESSKAPVHRYTVHGEIVSLDAEGNIAKIRHQAIEGWMGAMTMEFPVRDPEQFKALHPGDCITATVFVQDLNFSIGEIRHDTVAPGACVAAPAQKEAQQ